MKKTSVDVIGLCIGANAVAYTEACKGISHIAARESDRFARGRPCVLVPLCVDLIFMTIVG